MIGGQISLPYFNPRGTESVVLFFAEEASGDGVDPRRRLHLWRWLVQLLRAQVSESTIFTVRMSREEYSEYNFHTFLTCIQGESENVPHCICCRTGCVGHIF